MTDKVRIYGALKRKNYFHQGKEDSLAVFEKAPRLEDVIFQVERCCNVDTLFFRYNPTTRKFYRITPTKKDKDALNSEALYRVHPSCRKRKCLNKKINISDFVKLLDAAFEPIAVYEVSKIHI